MPSVVHSVMRSVQTPLAGLLSAVAIGLVPALPPAVEAQTQPQDAPVPFSAVRALNLARGTAITRNGGLGVYRPAQCMYVTAAAGNECLVSSDAQGYRFRFQGGAPGWQQLGLPATFETELRISPDGRSVVEVLYNGAPR